MTYHLRNSDGDEANFQKPLDDEQPHMEPAPPFGWVALAIPAAGAVIIVGYALARWVFG